MGQFEKGIERCPGQSHEETVMSTLYNLLRGNMLPRVLVGFFVGYYLYQGALDRPAGQLRLITPALGAGAQVQTSTKSDYTDRIKKLAQTDHIALLKWSLEHYDKNIQDYSATFYKQERIDKKIKPLEEIDILFKDEPFSVLMRWRKNAGSIDKLLYVEGQNDNKMVVHPTGLFSWIDSVKRDPRCKKARESTQRTCDQFGFYRSMQSLLEVYEQAGKAGDLQIKYLGETKVDKRKCVAMERLLPPKASYPYGRLVMEFDVEYLLPTAITAYDWKGKLVSQYVYKDLSFNRETSAEKFTPQANNL